jgi:hypothetical protein
VPDARSRSSSKPGIESRREGLPSQFPKKILRNPASQPRTPARKSSIAVLSPRTISLRSEIPPSMTRVLRPANVQPDSKGPPTRVGPSTGSTAPRAGPSSARSGSVWRRTSTAPWSSSSRARSLASGPAALALLLLGPDPPGGAGPVVGLRRGEAGDRGGGEGEHQGGRAGVSREGQRCGRFPARHRNRSACPVISRTSPDPPRRESCSTAEEK